LTPFQASGAIFSFLEILHISVVTRYWYPNSRDEQLHMVKTGNTVFATSGRTWGIPQEHITQLVNDEGAARTKP
jgi:hypothetical protein